MEDPVPLDSVDIARACYLAYARKDRGAMEALISEDFRFTSPFDNGINRETYFRRCWPNSEIIGDFKFIHLVADGDRVFVTYEVSNTRGKRFRNTEALTIRDAKLVEAAVYFGWAVPHEAPEGGFLVQGSH